MLLPFIYSLVIPYLIPTCSAACTPSSTSTEGLQSALTSGGEGYVLQLCAGETYSLQQPLNYTAANQEISTEGYPTDETRAMIVVDGFNISSAVRATNDNLSGVKLRNVQINGNRNEEDIYKGGGANIEFGGNNQNQLVEYVRSYNPRGWSCVHIAEGPFTCSNVTIQNNDIGPCGSDVFQEWADGISLSCQSSLVQNNVIVDATDGGIVIFGAPFSMIRNNTISVKTRTTLGGINLVDVLPWAPPGNYSHTVVSGNTINGGFATGMGNDTFGTNNASAMIKIGIAIGPEVWFNQRFENNQSTGGIVENNILSGAFAFGIAVATARDFVISNNSFAGNVSFIGDYGQNCTGAYLTPNPPTPLLQDMTSLTNVTLTLPSPPSSDHSNTGNIPNIGTFINGTSAGLTCFIHPATDFVGWPYGGGGLNALPTTTTTSTGEGVESSLPAQSSSTSSGVSDNGATGSSVSLVAVFVVGVGSMLGFLVTF